MDQVVVWLIKHRVTLGRLVITSTIIPFLLSTINLLALPMLLASGMLFLTLNWNKIRYFIFGVFNAHFWLKIQYFWFTIGFIIFSVLVYVNLAPFVPVQYVVGTTYLIVNVIWFNKINILMTEDGSRIILKGDTTESSSSKDFEPYLIPLILTLMIVFVISSLISIVITRARSIFTLDTIHWYFTLVILIVYFLIDMIFVEQIRWNPSGGTTQWRPIDFELDLPRIDDPTELSQYYYEAGKLSQPPPESKDFITDHFPYLLKEAQNLDYFPFQLNYVRAMENWGREGRDQLHLMFTMILASISQYRFTGLIPLYKRKMFYQGLQIIAMSGSMTTRWRELIEFEVINDKDEHFVLDWVLGSRYLEFKYNPDWIIAWEGTIFKGKAGYYEAVQKMEHVIQIRPEMDAWEVDLWNQCYKYAKVFIGENSRELFSENVKFYDQLLFMADKKTSEEYKVAKKQRTEQLLNPSNRLVAVHEDKSNQEYSEDERSQIIDSYLSSEPQDYTAPSLIDTIVNSLKSFKTTVMTMEVSKIFRLIGYLVMFVLNVILIWLVDLWFTEQIGILIISIEVVILFILSISPSDADMKLDDKQQRQSAVLSSTTASQMSIQINTAKMSNGILYLLYGIGLLIVYRFLFF